MTQTNADFVLKPCDLSRLSRKFPLDNPKLGLYNRHHQSRNRFHIFPVTARRVIRHSSFVIRHKPIHKGDPHHEDRRQRRSPEHPLRGRHAAHSPRGARPPARPRHPKRIGSFPGHLRTRRRAGRSRDTRHPGVPRHGGCGAQDRARLFCAARPPRSGHGSADRAGSGLLRHGRHLRADDLRLRPVAAAAADQGGHGAEHAAGSRVGEHRLRADPVYVG